jgi:hypothetical protein
MSVIGSNLIAGASGQGGGYNLTNSLRFRSSASAYLNRTPASAGNRKTWTWSGWVKRGKLGERQQLFSNLTGTTDNTFGLIGFTGADKFEYSAYDTQFRTSTQVFRDSSAWYHIVAVMNTPQATATNRFRVYINGIEITAWDVNTAFTQNADYTINQNTLHTISGSYLPLDGYLAEVNFIDGQALTPSSFGETSTTTGVWQPIKYAGTYGTNGFYLPFTDNSALTTSSNVGLGKDFSGNGNYWTTNNISITAGTTYDSMTDVPTLTSATTANFAVMNPNWKSSTASTSNANLTVSQTGALDVSQTTMGVSSGKWYWETTITSIGSTPSPMIGVVKGGGLDSYTSANGYYYWSNSGQKFNNGTAASYGATYTTNDVIGVALDMDAGTLTFYKNNTSQGTAYSGLSGTFSPTFTNGGGPTISWSAAVNFGQRPFAYTPPTGFNRLNAFNLPTPTIGASASTLANKNFNAVLYTGNGSTNTINSVGFQPDMVWIKARSASANHALLDSVRPSGFALYPNLTSDEGNNSSLFTGITSNGFGLAGNNVTYNESAATYVAWNWRANGTPAVTNTAGSITSQVSANTSAGFSVVTYTGTGANATVGHGLGVAPKMVIVKNRTSAGNSWCTWHIGLTSAAFSVFLDSTGAQGNFPTIWNSTAPTSSVFSVGSATGTNGSTNGMVAYCFAEIAGYSAFGSYTGNGSSDGPFVFTGFRPRFIMLKRTDSTGDWTIYDSARDPENTVDKVLFPNFSDAESSGTDFMDFVSNGFKLRQSGTNRNASGGTYIYMAFAESPFKYANAR